MPPTLPPKRPPLRIAPPPAAPVAAPRTVRSFKVQAWTGEGQGQKIIIYGASGKGKTTLASMAPAPVFIGLDDGGRNIRDPRTGGPVQHVDGVMTFQDVRDALQQIDLWKDAKSVIIDTGTALELLAMQWVIETVPHEKANVRIKRIEDYGYGKGYTHMFDAMRCVFQDCDTLVRAGKNIILVCQQCPIVVANPSGANYLENGPKLYAPGPDSKQSFTTRGYACEWADHVFKVDYLQTVVAGGGQDATTGKERAGKVGGVTTRAVFTMPSDPSYFAKTRTLTDPVVSFATASDDSLWRIMFPQEG